MKEKLKLIYIIGAGRSGSTLLERLLGQHGEIFAAGELKQIWERSFVENQLCGCGKDFLQCEVWEKISKVFFKKIDDFNVDKIIQAHKKIDRVRFFPYLYLLKRKKKTNINIETINKYFYLLYRSIQEVTKKTYIIDSSKHPQFAYILSMNDKIDLYVIHLVRDVGGVAYSWGKKKIRPEITGKVEHMPTYNVWVSSILWLVANKLSEIAGRQSKVYKRIKYEDLASEPKKVLTDLFHFLNLNNETEDIFLCDNVAKLNKNHTVSGNPMRFRSGEIMLRQDEKWKENMCRKDKIISSILALPFSKKPPFKRMDT